MQIIQPHYHAIARTAQDYERMAMSERCGLRTPDGLIVVIRKLLLIISLRFPSSSLPGLRNSVSSLSGCGKPKEAANKELTAEVLRQMPEFLDKPTCLGVAKLDYQITPNEIESLQAHVEMAQHTISADPHRTFRQGSWH